MTHLTLVGSGAGVVGNIDGKVVAIVAVGVVEMGLDVLLPDGTWFEWLLYDVYMYLPLLPLQPFGWPPVVLCYSLFNLAF